MGLQFLAEHVQMDDVRLYIRDALKEYARLQTFAPRPSWNAVCYTGRQLLEQFGFPYPADREASHPAFMHSSQACSEPSGLAADCKTDYSSFTLCWAVSLDSASVPCSRLQPERTM